MTPAKPMGLFRRKGPRVPLRERYRTSRAIFGQSWRLMAKERDLWIFPVLSTLTFLTWGGLYWLFGYQLGLNDALARFGPGWASTTVEGAFLGTLLMIPLFYPLGITLSLLQGAIVFSLHERLEGRPGDKRAAIRRAWDQLGPIARFNLVAMLVAGLLATIGFLLNKLRLIPYLGRVLSVAGNLGWAVAAYFVIPILVVERERSALEALRASTALARQQWGKSVAGMVTIGLAMFVPFLAILLVVYALFMAAIFTLPAFVSGETVKAIFIAFFVAIVAVLVIAVLAGLILGQVTQAAYQVALYRYARTGLVSGPYTTATLADAWAPYRSP